MSAPKGRAEAAPLLKCPKCDNDNTDLKQFVEDVPHYRDFVLRGTDLICDMKDETDSDDNETSNPRIVCQALVTKSGKVAKRPNPRMTNRCNNEFPVPDELDVEYGS